MVRAILGGRKTQTRRVITPQPPDGLHETFAWFAPEIPATEKAPEGFWYRDGTGLRFHARSPFGAPGSHLWVREAIRFVGATPMGDLSEYEADGTLTKADGWPWQRARLASIHCPRGLSRITLEITAVRVERVQAITEADARAEGVEREAWLEDITDEDGSLNAECGYFPPRSHVAGYARLWDALNTQRGYGWDVNPWVWVLEFRPIS